MDILSRLSANLRTAVFAIGQGMRILGGMYVMARVPPTTESSMVVGDQYEGKGSTEILRDPSSQSAHDSSYLNVTLHKSFVLDGTVCPRPCEG